MDEMLTAHGGAIKALGEGKVGGYLAYFTGPDMPDLDGEYFTADTDFGLEVGYPVVGAPALVHHGLPVKSKDGTEFPGRVEAIGKIVSVRKDDTGLWAEAIMDMRKDYEQRVYQMVEQGVLSWSSGALPQSVQTERDGRIKRWYIVEGSLTPTPAEPRFTGIRPIKSLMDAAQDSPQTAKEPTEVKAPMEPAVPAVPTVKPQKETKTMQPKKAQKGTVGDLIRQFSEKLTPDELASLVDTIMGEAEAPAESMAAEDTAMSYDDPTMRSTGKSAGIPQPDPQVYSVRQQVGKTHSANGAQSPNYGALPTVQNRMVHAKYGHLSAEDISYVIDAAELARKRGENVVIAGGTDDGMKTLLQIFADHALDAHKSGAIKGMKGADLQRLDSLKHQKADELNYTTQAGFGAEWVNTLWRDQLWLRARRENRVLSLMNQISLGAAVEEHPTEKSDPTVYFVPETTDSAELNPAASPIPYSKIGTNKQTFTAKKLGLNVSFSEEMDEDSIIQFTAQARTQAARAMSDAIDMVLINGDTAGANNINLDGGSPAATERYRIFDATLKYALGATGLDAAGLAVNLRLLREARYKLNREANSDIDNIVMFIPPEMESSMLDMDEFVTMDKAGPNATAFTGQLGRVDGIPVVISSQMVLAATNGKVSSTPGNNLYGRALYLYRPYWNVGFRRSVTSSLEKIPWSDAYIMTMTVRLDLKQHTDLLGASLLYNLAT